MPEAGMGFAMTLLKAGIETPEQLLAMTEKELTFSGGIGAARAKKIVRELAKGGWRLADEPARTDRKPFQSKGDRLNADIAAAFDEIARFEGREPDAEPTPRPGAVDAMFKEFQ